MDPLFEGIFSKIAWLQYGKNIAKSTAKEIGKVKPVKPVKPVSPVKPVDTVKSIEPLKKVSNVEPLVARMYGVGAGLIADDASKTRGLLTGAFRSPTSATRILIKKLLKSR